jgi:hypothetical protein
MKTPLESVVLQWPHGSMLWVDSSGVNSVKDMVPTGPASTLPAQDKATIDELMGETPTALMSGKESVHVAVRSPAAEVPVSANGVPGGCSME